MGVIMRMIVSSYVEDRNYDIKMYLVPRKGWQYCRCFLMPTLKHNYIQIHLPVLYLFDLPDFVDTCNSSHLTTFRSFPDILPIVTRQQPNVQSVSRLKNCYGARSRYKTLCDFCQDCAHETNELKNAFSLNIAWGIFSVLFSILCWSWRPYKSRSRVPRGIRRKLVSYSGYLKEMSVKTCVIAKNIPISNELHRFSVKLTYLSQNSYSSSHLSDWLRARMRAPEIGGTTTSNIPVPIIFLNIPHFRLNILKLFNRNTGVMSHASRVLGRCLRNCPNGPQPFVGVQRSAFGTIIRCARVAARVQIAALWNTRLAVVASAFVARGVCAPVTAPGVYLYAHIRETFADL